MKNLIGILLLIVPLCLLAQKDSMLIQEASFKYKVIKPVYEERSLFLFPFHKTV